MTELGDDGDPRFRPRFDEKQRWGSDVERDPVLLRVLDTAVQVAEGGPEDMLRQALFRENMAMVQEYGGERFRASMGDDVRQAIGKREIVKVFRSVVRLILLEWGPEPEVFMRDYMDAWRESMK